jgi:hypothetical protein
MHCVKNFNFCGLRGAPVKCQSRLPSKIYISNSLLYKVKKFFAFFLHSPTGKVKPNSGGYESRSSVADLKSETG